MSGADNTKPGTEPSMDDILASIRKILNEDDAPGAPATIPEPPSEPLMLTEEMMVPEPQLPAAVAPEPAVPQPVATPAGAAALAVAPAPVIAQPAPAPMPEAPPPMAAPMAPPIPPPGLQIVAPPPKQRPAAMPEPPGIATTELVAPAAAAAAAASMTQLLRAVTQERSTAISRGGPTIEDVVRETIRPMLKEWLDTHLPGIVERSVRAEIERVARSGL